MGRVKKGLSADEFEDPWSGQSIEATHFRADACITFGEVL